MVQGGNQDYAEFPGGNLAIMHGLTAKPHDPILVEIVENMRAISWCNRLCVAGNVFAAFRREYGGDSLAF